MKQWLFAMKWLLAVMMLFLMGTMGGAAGRKADIPLQQVSLPAGFKIELYASSVPNARSMVLSPTGTLFVGTRKAGKFYAVLDQNDDFRADEVITLAKGLNTDRGIAVFRSAIVSPWRCLTKTGGSVMKYLPKAGFRVTKPGGGLWISLR